MHCAGEAPATGREEVLCAELERRVEYTEGDAVSGVMRRPKRLQGIFVLGA